MTSVAWYRPLAPVAFASPAIPSARTPAAAPNHPIDTATCVVSSSFLSPGLIVVSCTLPDCRVRAWSGRARSSWLDSGSPANPDGGGGQTDNNNNNCRITVTGDDDSGVPDLVFDVAETGQREDGTWQGQFLYGTDNYFAQPSSARDHARLGAARDVRRCPPQVVLDRRERHREGILHKTKPTVTIRA
jgi:hypothetical protein